MPIHANMYMHDLDRSTLQTLKAIPGFSSLMKAYMKVAAEQQYYIQNMSTNLRLSEKQLPHYYNMLPPICEKLGIPVPELYLKMDDTPNAYTYGDTKPFIVMTDGLLEVMPDELLPTILAHECGHIACHHTLYHNLGSVILSGGSSLLGLTELVTAPLQSSFYYWMRCSEYSADRAAAVCDGTSEKVKEMCMRFSGFGRRPIAQANMDAFMEQAAQYRQMMLDSKWSKTLEVLMYHQSTHPLNVVRAYESNEWQKTDAFRNINRYLEKANNACIPLPEAAKYYIGKPAEAVRLQMVFLGFSNIRMNRVPAVPTAAKPGNVLEVCVDRRVDYKPGSWYPPDTEVVISYYDPPTLAEIAAAHPGEIPMPNASKYYGGKPINQVIQELKCAGFQNIIPELYYNHSMNWISRPGTVAQISAGGLTQFDKGTWFKPDTTIRVYYYGYEAVIPPGNS